MNCENEAVSLVLGVNVIDPIMDSPDNAQQKWFGRTLRYYFSFAQMEMSNLIQKVSDSGV